MGCAWVPAHKALITNHFTSETPLQETKHGGKCEAGAFMNEKS